MIQISNLTKVYKSKKKNNHKALDNVSLTLPNNGLVFIIGKSGSGKSTLLNLLGGLDNTTSGSIIVDGNDITTFKESDLADYRNNHIGFIFQDYHLLDELTVYENIVLSLNLNKLEDNGLVLHALEKVGLSGYENRYPTELSGGERQRVAIARAIVKKPYVILADEPTGNLDNETGTQIISLLKELSNECLILIVSHNTIDTYKYADRIIKLSVGKIISDESRNPEYLDNISCVNNILYYPMDKTLNEEDINVINKKEFNKIIGKNDKYITTSINNNNERNIKIDKKNLSIKNIFKLCLTFLKSKIFRITASSFMISVIMVILSLAQTIITFDSNEIIKREMSKYNQNSLLLDKQMTDDQKSNSGGNYNVCIDDGDIQRFKDAGYNGDIYEVLSYSVPIASSTNGAGMIYNYYQNGIYINETFGTIIVDEEFLNKKFGDFEYKVKLDKFHPLGVVITDYIADAILAINEKYLGKSYEDILGPYRYKAFTTDRIIINGIIETNYKERYNDLFMKFLSGETNKVSDLYENSDFNKFNSELYDSLGYSYSLNSNLLNDYVGNKDIEIVWHYKLVFDDYEFVIVNGKLPYFMYDRDNLYDVKDNEIVMNMEKYNAIFNTNYTTDTINTFIPHTVNLAQYHFYDYDNENSLFNEEVYIKAISDEFSCTAVISDNLLEVFTNNVIMKSGLYFDGIDGIGNVIDLANELNYNPTTYTLEGIHTMTKAVDVFIPIFELVAIVLCAGIIFILISFSTKMIKDKMHEIGILKALGCKNNTIGFVFGLQLLLIAICTIILSTVGYFFFIDLANDVLIESLRVLAPSHIVLDLDFLTFKMNVVHINSLLIVILSLVSFVIPMLKIYSIKPVQIIKAKE